MTLSPAFVTIASAALAIVGLASLIVFLLRRAKPENHTFQKVSTITKSWWWIIGFVLLCLSFAPCSLLIGFAAVSIFSVFEFEKHSRLAGLRKHITALVLTGIVAQYVSLYCLAWSAFFAIPLIFVFLGFSVLIIISGRIEELTLIFSNYVGTIFIFHLLAYLPGLFIFYSHQSAMGEALYLIFFLILLTELNDVLQFICGKAFGKTKVFPLISPNKTGAGFLGGIVGTTLLGGWLFWKFAGFDLSRGLTLGLIIAISGILGDLSFSALKRYLGTKDFSNALPGHGGVLDRLDSLIFTTPCVFYFLYFT